MSIELAHYLADILFPIRIFLICTSFISLIYYLKSENRDHEFVTFILFIIIGLIGVLLPSENTLLLMAGDKEKSVFERSIDE